MNTKYILIATTLIAAATAVYMYMELDKTKTYIKGLPDPYGTVDGMPKHS